MSIFEGVYDLTGTQLKCATSLSLKSKSPRRNQQNAPERAVPWRSGRYASGSIDLTPKGTEHSPNKPSFIQKPFQITIRTATTPLQSTTGVGWCNIPGERPSLCVSSDLLQLRPVEFFLETKLSLYCYFF